MLISVLFIILSLVLLYFGAEWLVKGSSMIALRYGISPLVIGLTIVALGTSSPELFVGLTSALNGQGGIAVGNAIGSNIFNISIILGITALFSPLRIKMQILKIDIPFATGSALLFFFLFYDRNLSRWEGALLVLLLASYIFMNLMLARKEKNEEVIEEFSSSMPEKNAKWYHSPGLIVTGLVLLIGGSKLLVHSATEIALAIDISETVIGLTIVAAGTSMPELATSIIAAKRKEYDIAVGNVVGSNIFNILGILGITALVKPLYALPISNIDLYFMLALTFVLYPFFRSKYTLKRDEAIFLVLLYGVYMYYLWPK